MSEYQSAYCSFHNSGTALLRVQNDILASLDSGHFIALLLDLSTAFENTDHNILLHRLKHWFGTSSSTLLSFLATSFQTVIASKSESQPVLLEFGTPQGKVLGPLLFSLHTTPLHSMISKYYGHCCHFYANDAHVLIFP